MAAQVRASPRGQCPSLLTDSDGRRGARRWWPKVTARHLLSQTGGCVTGETSGLPGYPECYSAPGTNWTYDSEDFIGHLSLLVNATAGGVPAVEWATKNFAEVLGLGDLYKWDDDGTNFVAGGGQMMSCRQHAKVGQLLANRGAWPSSAALRAIPLEKLTSSNGSPFASSKVVNTLTALPASARLAVTGE